MTVKNCCTMDRVLLEEYVEGMLGSFEKFLIDEHVKACSTCRKELMGLKLLSWELNSLATTDIEFPDTLDDICEELISTVCQGRREPFGSRIKHALSGPRKAVSTVYGITKTFPLTKQAKKLTHVLKSKVLSKNGLKKPQRRKHKALYGRLLSLFNRTAGIKKRGFLTKGISALIGGAK